MIEKINDRMDRRKAYLSMSTVFRLDASVRGNESVTRGIADTLEHEILDNATNTHVIRRDIAREPIPAGLWAQALSGPVVPTFRLYSA